MNTMKHLTEEQQAVIYKKLCEAALRVYACNDELQSTNKWRDVFDSIILVTGIKVRKSSKGLRLSTDNAYEDVSMNTSNSLKLDCIKKMINAMDNDPEQGDKCIKRIYLLCSYMYTK